MLDTLEDIVALELPLVSNPDDFYQSIQQNWAPDDLQHLVTGHWSDDIIGSFSPLYNGLLSNSGSPVSPLSSPKSKHEPDGESNAGSKADLGHEVEHKPEHSVDTKLVTEAETHHRLDDSEPIDIETAPELEPELEQTPSREPKEGPVLEPDPKLESSDQKFNHPEPNIVNLQLNNTNSLDETDPLHFRCLNVKNSAPLSPIATPSPKYILSKLDSADTKSQHYNNNSLQQHVPGSGSPADFEMKCDIPRTPLPSDKEDSNSSSHSSKRSSGSSESINSIDIVSTPDEETPESCGISLDYIHDLSSAGDPSPEDRQLVCHNASTRIPFSILTAKLNSMGQGAGYRDESASLTQDPKLVLLCIRRVFSVAPLSTMTQLCIQNLFHPDKLKSLCLPPLMFLPTKRVPRVKSANGRGKSRKTREREGMITLSSRSRQSSASPQGSGPPEVPEFLPIEAPWKRSAAYPLGFIPISAWLTMDDLPEMFQFSKFDSAELRRIPPEIFEQENEHGLWGYSPVNNRSCGFINNGTSNHSIPANSGFTYEILDTSECTNDDMYSASLQRSRQEGEGTTVKTIAERYCGLCKKFYGRDNSQYVQHMKHHHGVSASTRDYYVTPWLMAEKPIGSTRSNKMDGSKCYVAYCDQCQTWVGATRSALAEKDYKSHVLYSPWFSHMSSHLGDDNILDRKSNEKSPVSQISANRVRYRERALARRAKTIDSIKALIKQYNTVSSSVKEGVTLMASSSLLKMEFLGELRDPFVTSLNH
uniref:ARAD1A02728p n=1 Tax=Blastobotrys adeninivorans TaxID=409370 RepID=A0A060SW82_BLAAD